MSRVVKDALLVLVCLALVVSAVLLVSGKLPYEVYIVHTGSMAPTIPSKSAVLVKKGAYQLGQVISFRTQNGVVTHRLTKRGADGALITKGDANRTVDPGSVRPSQIIGEVVAAPRMLGYWLQYLKNPAGLGSLFMTIVCFWLIYSITVGLAARQQLASALAAERRVVAPLMPRGVPLSLFGDPDHHGHLNVGAPRCPGIDVAVAQSVGYDRLAAVWKPVMGDAPVVFTCWRCGAAFANTGELRDHVAAHRDAVGEVRQRVATAALC